MDPSMRFDSEPVTEARFLRPMSPIPAPWSMRAAPIVHFLFDDGRMVACHPPMLHPCPASLRCITWLAISCCRWTPVSVTVFRMKLVVSFSIHVCMVLKLSHLASYASTPPVLLCLR